MKHGIQTNLIGRRVRVNQKDFAGINADSPIGRRLDDSAEVVAIRAVDGELSLTVLWDSDSLMTEWSLNFFTVIKREREAQATTGRAAFNRVYREDEAAGVKHGHPLLRTKKPPMPANVNTRSEALANRRSNITAERRRLETALPGVTLASDTQFEIHGKRYTIQTLERFPDGSARCVVRDDGGEFMCSLTTYADKSGRASYCGRVRENADPRLAAAAVLID